MKKKIILLILIVLFIFTGCSMFELSSENKEKAKEYEKTGKEMAIDHISNKYGFTPKVKKSEAETGRDSLGPLYLTGYVYVTMEYDGHTFYVKVPVKNDYEIEIKDTYQNDIIKNDLIIELESIFNTKVVYLESYLDFKRPRGIIYYSDYYDGTNLNDFVPSFNAGVINASTLDKDKEEKLKKLTKGNIDISIYNYKSESDYKKTSNIQKKQYVSATTMEAIYLKDKYEKRSYNNDIAHYNIDIKKSDIIIGNESAIKGKIYSINNYDRKKLSNEELDNIFKHYNKKPKVLLNSIYLKDVSANFIYISKEYYKKYKITNAIYYCQSNNVNNSSEFKQVGDYYYANLLFLDNCKDVYILLIKGR